MKRAGVVLTSAASVALALTACGSKPSSSGAAASGGSSGSGTPFSACMVLDTGGIDDHSFNESSYAGMKAAQQENKNIKISYAPSNSQNDYTPNLNAAVQKNCDSIVAVGGLMADAVKAVATANPNKHFAEVDNASQAPNQYGIQFNTAQGAFLGGYLAAAMASSGPSKRTGVPSTTISPSSGW